MRAFILIVMAVFRDLIRISFRTRAEITAEDLFLRRRQLALYGSGKTVDIGPGRLPNSRWYNLTVRVGSGHARLPKLTVLLGEAA